MKSDREYLANQLKAEAAQLLWNDRDRYYIIRIDTDPVVQCALNLFGRAKEVAAVWQKPPKG